MAELIFAEQTLAFEYFEEMGMYTWQSTDATPIFALAEGQTYTVLWDGTPYSATAKEMSLDDITGIGLGNEGIVGIGEDNGQPFIFAYLSDIGTNGMNACYSTAEGDTHTVSVYEGVLEEETPGANIVLYDRNGNPVTYEGIETVSFNTDVDGEIATYTHGTATDEVAVALDLSAGNQTVTPEGADFVKKVVIEKPDTLLPENIKKGVEVAGVVGDLIGEGVSKEVELDLADGDQTVEADPETLMSEVIIKKPETLLPENIAKDVEIAGVVGTLKAGGGMGLGFIMTEVSGRPNMVSGPSTSGTLWTYIPEDAKDIGFYCKFRCSAYNSSYSSLGTTAYTEILPTATLTREPSGTPGFDKVTFGSFTFEKSGAAYLSAIDMTLRGQFTMPNVYLKDNILYAGADCKGLFSWFAFNNAYQVPVYMEGVDLRGSQVKTLMPNAFAGHTELKKIWLSEVMESFQSSAFYGVLDGLEELHFTATTPMTLSSADLSGLNTSCKLYVPAGALDAYTSAANYPSASNYTYIEE